MENARRSGSSSPRLAIGVGVALYWIAPLLIASYASDEPHQRGAQPVASEALLEQGFETYDRRVALVVGIDEYAPAVGELSYAVRDARGVEEMLRFHLGFDEVVVLENQEAGRVDILRALLELGESLNQGDQFLVFFAGHGTTYGTERSEMGYLVPYDADSLSKTDVVTAGISMADLRSRLVGLPAKHVLLLVDACYSGYAAVGSRGRSRQPLSPSYLREITREPARQLITAGKRHQRSFEADRWGHSAFTYKLLQGLREHLADSDRNGIVTAMELATFLSSSVHSLTQGKQTPQFAEFTLDEGEFVFILPKASHELDIELSRPAEVEIIETRVDVKDRLGQILWRHTAEARVETSEILDLDGDGSVEVVVGFGAEGGARINVFDHRGDLIWSKEPPASAWRGVSSGHMVVTDLASGKLLVDRADEAQQLVVVWNDADGWPRGLVGVLDDSGVVATYRNPGQIEGVEVVPSQLARKAGLVVYGFNGELAHAHAGEGRLSFLALLDASEMSGWAPPGDGKPVWYAVVSPRPAAIQGVEVSQWLHVRLQGGNEVRLTLEGLCVTPSCDGTGVDFLQLE